MHACRLCNARVVMKTLSVRLPEDLAAAIAAEARRRRVSTSDIVRERLQSQADTGQDKKAAFISIADLIGSVRGLSPDLSARKKQYLKRTGYGRHVVPCVLPD